MAPHARWLGMVLMLALAPLATIPQRAVAEVLNEEILFTPFRGDPKDSDWVQVLPGRVSLQLNGVSLPEEVIEAGRDMVFGLEPSLRLSGELKIHTHSIGPMLRQSGNVLELRFTPSDGQSPYRSYFGWRRIGDSLHTETQPDGRIISSNFAADGAELQESRHDRSHQRRRSADHGHDPRSTGSCARC